MEDEEPYYEQYKKLKLEIETWCRFDVTNLPDKAMGAVNMKQWIVARLHDFKRERLQIVRLKNKLQKIEIDKKIESSPVVLDKSTLEKIAKLPKMADITEKIENLDLLIGYLADMVKMFMYIAQDVKNVIDVKKLETT